MKRYFILILTLFTFSVVVKAQQVAQFSQLIQNRHMLNPAAAGEFKQHNVLLGFRKQWVGMEYSPTTYYVGYNSAYQKEFEPERQPLAIRTARTNDFSVTQFNGGYGKVKHGFGGYIVGDNYGAFKNMSLNLNYAVHAELKEGVYGSIGVNTRFRNMRFNQDIAQVENAGDVTYDAFVAERNGLTSIEFDLGAYLYGEGWYAGYSTNQLTGDAIVLGSVSSNILELHHTFIGGYTFALTDQLALQPATMVKYAAGAPLSVDILSRMEISEAFDAGIGYRTSDALMLLFGYTFEDKYRIGYSYDVGIGGASSQSTGSHEVTIGAIF